MLTAAKTRSRIRDFRCAPLLILFGAIFFSCTESQTVSGISDQSTNPIIASQSSGIPEENQNESPSPEPIASASTASESPSPTPSSSESISVDTESSPGPTPYAILKLSSGSTGPDTNGIIVLVKYPQSFSGTRYAAQSPQVAAPVVIEVPGSFTVGTIDYGSNSANHDLTPFGFVHIQFLFPGGTSSDGSYTSGGSFDDRGAASMEALADVVQFAQGVTQAKFVSGSSTSLTTETNYTLSQVAGYDVSTTNVGLLALSNGGNISTVAFSHESTKMSNVAWYVGWENPSGDFFINLDVGAYSTGSNTNYTDLTSCTNQSCASAYGADSTKLICDTTHTQDLSPTNLITNTTALSGVPTVCYDSDGDGFCGGTTDIAFKFATAKRTPTSSYQAYLSVPLMLALGSKYTTCKNTVNATSPNMLPTLTELRQFWGLRQPNVGSYTWSDAMTANPNLKIMVLASDHDHVQIASDHPHILIQLQGWLNAHASFVRLNPDSAYLSKAGLSSSVDVPAQSYSASPSYPYSTYSWLNWGGSSVADPTGAVEPHSQVTPSIYFYAAGVMEMADRTVKANWTANLSEVLVQ